MRLKLIPALAFVVLCLFAFRAQGQVTSSATSNTAFPLKVGVGISDFRTSHGPGTIMGGTLWVDYTLPRLPHFLYGLGLEAEARDLNLSRSATQPKNMRIDEAQGGVIYSWHHLKSLRPYAKALMGYGNVDTMANATTRKHDSRTITVLGGGLDYRIYRNVWARVDYQYQFWPDFWKNKKPAGSLTPSGFTFGAVYDFGHSRSR